MNRWVAGVLGTSVAAAPLLGAAAELRTIETDQPFDALVERVEQAVEANELAVVTKACASCGAAERGVDIPGNMVLGVFRNDFAVRMLEASAPSGIEAPIRFYVTESESGADLHWKPPSEVFAGYDGPGLDDLVAELDEIFETIADTATN